MKIILKKTVSLFLAFAILVQMLLPVNRAIALNSGPSSPEFSGSEPVGINNLVSPFTGDFAYNVPVVTVPGPNGGYAISLGYHNPGADEEASWVGYGWNLSPGAVSRQKRGFPDDAKGTQTTYNKVENNTTVSLSLGVEADATIISNASASITSSLRYNNKTGLSTSAITGASLGLPLGVATLNSQYDFEDQTTSWDFTINPISILNIITGGGAPGGLLECLNKAENEQILALLNKSTRIQFNSNTPGYSLFNNERATKLQPYTCNVYGFNYSANVGFKSVDETGGTSLDVGIGNTLAGYYTNVEFDTEYSNDFVGYLYSKDAESDDLMDYGVERGGRPYDVKEKYLSTPFANADQFVVSSLGLNGSFRAFSKGVGHFAPNKVENTVQGYDMAIGINVGVQPDGNIGIGGNVGLASGKAMNEIMQTIVASASPTILTPMGFYYFLYEFCDGTISILTEYDDYTRYNYSSISRWDYSNADEVCNFCNDNNDDSHFYFRFEGDKSGSTASFDDNAKSQELTESNVDNDWTEWFSEGAFASTSNMYLGKIYTIEEDENEIESFNQTRSANISFYTNGEMVNEIDNDGNYIKRYTTNDQINSYVKRDQADIADQIGEFIITNEQGAQFVYGLPVFAKNEAQLSYEVSIDEADRDKIVYSEIDGTDQDKIGEVVSTPFTASWLLTSQFSYDYVDRKFDGPTDDDFGGWTKFHYTRAIGNNDLSDDDESNWFHYRTPFNGLLYSRNSLSDPDDDKGSLMSGDKQVYYLSKIETKTHIAVFTTADRIDGYESDDDAIAANNSNAIGTDKLQQLSNIKIYVKDEDGNPGKLLSTTYFEYDYSLRKGISDNPGTTTASLGTLTLKRIWTENEGTFLSKINPIEFEYQYPSDGVYPVKYDALDNYGAYSESAQFPDYNPNNVDPWGYYRYDGDSRENKLQNWVDQTPDETNFDPAAWQLKVIKLPTGGQIHIQYEQKEYAYVQDKKAMAMVSIDKIEGSDDKEGNAEDKFYLNLTDDLDINGEYSDYGKLLISTFSDNKVKLHVLYALDQITKTDFDMNDCGVEYIDAYLRYKNSEVSSSGAYLTFGSGDDESYSTIREVGIDYFKNFREGLLSESSGDCKIGIDDITTSGNTVEALTEVLYSMMAYLGNDFGTDNICNNINEGESYIRVPVLDGKKGGGLRVKRILMFDSGIESGDEALYGKEYNYVTQDGKCSGVAGNEPTNLENALVNSIDDFQRSSSWYEKAVSGKDREEFEGPIGASLLPSPSVGYSRVVEKNIHDGITNDGITVNEFYTTKDYPTIIDVDNIVKPEAISYSYTLPQFGTNFSDEYSGWGLGSVSGRLDYATQGVSVILNAMNGQPKSTTIYAADYDDEDFAENGIITAQTKYEYAEPGEKLDVITKYWDNAEYDWDNINAVTSSSTNLNADGLTRYILDGGNFETEGRVIGRTEDQITEAYVMCDSTKKYTFDLTITIVPAPFLFYMLNTTENLVKLYSHTNSKLIYYPSIVKSVTQTNDGITSKVENLYYDAASGEPVVQRSYDGYNELTINGSTHDGSYISYSFPSTRDYEQMGCKSYNEQYKLSNGGSTGNVSKLVDGGKWYLYFEGIDCEKILFTPGDLLSITSYNYDSDGERFSSNEVEVYHAGEMKGSFLEIFPTESFYSSASNHNDVDVEVLRSGRTNQLSASEGSVTTYGGEPTVNFVSIEESNPTEWDARIAFADELNELTTNATDGTFSITSTENIFSSGSSCSNSTDVGFRKLISNYSYEECTVSISTDGNGNSSVTKNCVDNTISLNKYEFTFGDCEVEIETGGTFIVDPNTAEIIYYIDECNQTNIECSIFCNDLAPYTELDKVVATSAITLSDNWSLADNSNAEEIYFSASPITVNDYEAAYKGKFRPKSNYSYSTTRTGLNSTGVYAYNAGVFDDYKLFNYQQPDVNLENAWIKASETILYSPFGVALQDTNALGINSVVKVGYNKTLPYLVASNADYNSVMAESFENSEIKSAIVNSFEDNFTINTTSPYYGGVSTTYAHTGESSLKLEYVTASTLLKDAKLELKEFTVTDQIKDEGMIVKFWLKMNDEDNISSLKVTNASSSFSSECVMVAKTGEWNLFSATISPTQIGSLTSIKPIIVLMVPTSLKVTEVAYIDDIRVQPTNSQSNTYVYDKNALRLLSVLDDQNFATYNQYNQEGKLVRKMFETTEGIKTITETQYNIPGQSR